MDDTRTVDLTSSEIKRLIDVFHEFFGNREHDGEEKTEADKLLLMKLVEALR
jgi:hypothetical protein